MIALASWLYKDPMLVVMSKQHHAINRSCAGCANAKETKVFGNPITVCVKAKPYGRRCDRYEVKNG